MATMGENLRTWLLADAGVSAVVDDRVNHNVPVSEGGPSVFFAQTSTDESPALDDGLGQEPFSYSYTLECWGRTEAEAESVATAVRAKHLYAGEFGDRTVQRVFIKAQNEDYVPKGDGSEGAFRGVFLDMTVIPFPA